MWCDDPRQAAAAAAAICLYNPEPIIKPQPQTLVSYMLCFCRTGILLARCGVTAPARQQSSKHACQTPTTAAANSAAGHHHALLLWQQQLQVEAAAAAMKQGWVEGLCMLFLQEAATAASQICLS
jgi:hypothetical protein